MDGSQVAQRIIDMYLWAKNDIKRATTYNKGIMNGVDAVALACGQDWRAIEAACHGFASINGYRPLSKYDIQNIEGVNHLYAELTLPIAVGTVGGAIKSNPFYSHALGLMKHPNSQQLAQVCFKYKIVRVISFILHFLVYSRCGDCPEFCSIAGTCL